MTKSDSGRLGSGILLSVLHYTHPIATLLLCVVIFIGVDFLTGCWAGLSRARRSGRRWFFSSHVAWRTIEKLFFSLGVILLSFILTRHVIGFIPHSNLLPNICTAFICGVEFWSFLENAADISEARVFVLLRRFTINKAHAVDRELAEVLDREKID